MRELNWTVERLDDGDLLHRALVLGGSIELHIDDYTRSTEGLARAPFKWHVVLATVPLQTRAGVGESDEPAGRWTVIDAGRIAVDRGLPAAKQAAENAFRRWAAGIQAELPQQAGRTPPPRPATPGPLLLDPEAAAALIGCGRTHLYEMLKSGELRSIKVGRLRRIPRAELEAWVQRKVDEAAERDAP